MATDGSFEQLLNRYRGLLFSLCRRFSRQGLEFDDLFQEVCIALWRAREKLTMMGVGVQQAALVWKIARNAAIDNVRSLHTSEPLSESYDTVDEDRTLLQELHEQIAQLTEPDKSIVTMQLEGYSYEEIGKKLNISEKNVSVRLVRAREKIRGKMVNTL